MNAPFDLNSDEFLEKPFVLYSNEFLEKPFVMLWNLMKFLDKKFVKLAVLTEFPNHESWENHYNKLGELVIKLIKKYKHKFGFKFCFRLLQLLISFYNSEICRAKIVDTILIADDFHSSLKFPRISRVFLLYFFYFIFIFMLFILFSFILFRDIKNIISAFYKTL